MRSTEGEAERIAFLEAIEELLRPLMRSMLRFGLSHGDLVEVVRGLYIAAVRDQLFEQHRDVSVARLALTAGVTRSEAESILESRTRRRLARDEGSERVDKLVWLLSVWHDDSRFSTPYGAPLDLSLHTEKNFKTFDDLLAASSVGIDRDTVLDALIAAGCIETHEDKFVRCLSRTFIPAGIDIAGISRLGRYGGALNATIAHNLFRSSEEPSFFERTFVSDAPVGVEYRNLLLEFLREEGQQFVDKLCRWSAEKEIELGNPQGKLYGVGVYFYEDAKPLHRSATELISEAASS